MHSRYQSQQNLITLKINETDTDKSAESSDEQSTEAVVTNFKSTSNNNQEIEDRDSTSDNK